MKYIVVLNLFLVVSCTTKIHPANVKLEGSESCLLYIIPFEVERSLYASMVDKKFEKAEMYFVLSSNGTYFHLVGNVVANIEKEHFGFLKVSNAGRCVLINEKKYPLVFETDYLFGSEIDSVESIAKRQSRLNSEGLSISRGPYTINEAGVSIKFTKKGTIFN